MIDVNLNWKKNNMWRVSDGEMGRGKECKGNTSTVSAVNDWQ